VLSSFVIVKGQPPDALALAVAVAVAESWHPRTMASGQPMSKAGLACDQGVTGRHTCTNFTFARAVAESSMAWLKPFSPPAAAPALPQHHRLFGARIFDRGFDQLMSQLRHERHADDGSDVH